MTDNKLKGNEEINPAKKKCGIIMPIAACTDYPVQHWKDVKKILYDAVSEHTDFDARLVSEDVAVGLIHERIVTNIYNDEMVICDVSSKNPNVMFELGLRLAFDKPTIIIKDENTGYTFDAGVIEHINYPSSLRHQEIVEFKADLGERIKATYKKSKENNYSPFLKNFGTTIKPSSIEKNEISIADFMITMMDEMRADIHSIKLKQDYKRNIDIKNSSELDFVIRSAINKLQATGDIKGKGMSISRNHLRDIIFNDLRKNNFVLTEVELDEILNRYINNQGNVKLN